MSLTAPVKLPFLWPKNSLSMSSVGIAPQLTGTNGASRRGPGLVDHPRDELLARARFARDVHGRLAARDLRDHLRARCSIGGRLADEQRSAAAPLASGDRALELQRCGDELAQIVEIERLRDEIECAELERAHGRLDVAVRRDHGHRGPRSFALNPLDELEPVAVGQAHVGEAQVVRVARPAPAWRVARSAQCAWSMSIRCSVIDEQLADVGFVVDDEGGWIHKVSSPAASAADRRTRRETRCRPRASASSVASRRCARQSSREMYRPSPVPPG